MRWPSFLRTRQGASAQTPQPTQPAVQPTAVEPAAPAVARPAEAIPARPAWTALPALRPTVELNPPALLSQNLPEVATTRQILVQPARPRPADAPTGQVHGLARVSQPVPVEPAPEPSAPRLHWAPAVVDRSPEQPRPLLEAVDTYVGEPREPATPHRAPGWLRLAPPVMPDLNDIPGLPAALAAMPIRPAPGEPSRNDPSRSDPFRGESPAGSPFGFPAGRPVGPGRGDAAAQLSDAAGVAESPAPGGSDGPGGQRPTFFGQQAPAQRPAQPPSVPSPTQPRRGRLTLGQSRRLGLGRPTSRPASMPFQPPESEPDSEPDAAATPTSTATAPQTASQSQPSQPEPPQTEPSQADLSQAEPTPGGPSHGGPGQAEAGWSEQGPVPALPRIPAEPGAATGAEPAARGGLPDLTHAPRAGRQQRETADSDPVSGSTMRPAGQPRSDQPSSDRQLADRSAESADRRSQAAQGATPTASATPAVTPQVPQTPRAVAQPTTPTIADRPGPARPADRSGPATTPQRHGEHAGAEAPLVHPGNRPQTGSRPEDADRIEAVPYDLAREIQAAHGVDVGSVPVYRGPSTDQASVDLDARAFTTGEDVHLPGDAGPLTGAEARALIAHELTHVAQRLRDPNVPTEGSADSGRLEAEAAAVEAAVRASMPVPPIAATSATASATGSATTGGWPGSPAIGATNLSQRGGTGSVTGRIQRASRQPLVHPAARQQADQQPTLSGLTDELWVGSQDTFANMFNLDQGTGNSGSGNSGTGTSGSGSRGTGNGGTGRSGTGGHGAGGTGARPSDADIARRAAQLEQDMLMATNAGRPPAEQVTQLSDEQRRELDRKLDAEFGQGAGSGAGSGGQQSDSDRLSWSNIGTELADGMRDSLFGEFNLASLAFGDEPGAGSTTSGGTSGTAGGSTQSRTPGGGTQRSSGAGSNGAGGQTRSGDGAFGIGGPDDPRAGQRRRGTTGQPLLDGDDIDLDDLATQIYDRIRSRLRRELLVDRERSGLLSDFR